MTVFIEYLPYIAFAVVAAVVIVLAIIEGAKEGKAATDEMQDKLCEDLPNPEEIPLVETHVRVETMECGVYIEGIKTPHSGKTFLIKFRADDGELLEHPVEEEFYLSLSEGQTGTLATLNGYFYGFAADDEEDRGNLIESDEAPAEGIEETQEIE